MNAEVDVYFRDRGFGFVRVLDENNLRTKLFFHVNDVVVGEPIVGAKITFDLGRNEKGPVAKNIRIEKVG